MRQTIWETHPAVAKSAYVDPRIVELFEDGIVIDRPKRLVMTAATHRIVSHIGKSLS